MVHTIPWESPSFASLNSRKPALTYKVKYRYLADLRSKEFQKKKIPFWQPNIAQGEGATTSDVIGSVCADEPTVQSRKKEKLNSKAFQTTESKSMI